MEFFSFFINKKIIFDQKCRNVCVAAMEVSKPVGPGWAHPNWVGGCYYNAMMEYFMYLQYNRRILRLIGEPFTKTELNRLGYG